MTTTTQRKRSDTRWVIVNDPRWDKLRRHMTTLEREGESYPFKLTINRVASMVLARAIDELP